MGKSTRIEPDTPEMDAARQNRDGGRLQLTIVGIMTSLILLFIQTYRSESDKELARFDLAVNRASLIILAKGDSVGRALAEESRLLQISAADYETCRNHLASALGVVADVLEARIGGTSASCRVQLEACRLRTRFSSRGDADGRSCQACEVRYVGGSAQHEGCRRNGPRFERPGDRC